MQLTTSIMAKIGTKNGSNGRDRDFVMRQAMARTRSAANTTPKRLSEHKEKVDDDRKTGVVKRRVNALVEPNAC